MRDFRKAAYVIGTLSLLVLGELILLRLPVERPLPIARVPAPPVFSASMLAFGDINLGRWLGQRIQNGDVDFPFQRLDLRRDSADIVFANLESVVSYQNGRTGDPKNNLIFNSPPGGIQSLKKAGITIVSTANNHAFDYLRNGVFESMERLEGEGLLFVGSSRRREKVYDPVIIEKHNIKFAIFAVTSFMNYRPKRWDEVVAHADTGKLFPIIRKFRPMVDFVILSFHGGSEYTNNPVRAVTDFADQCVRNGVDVFLGHHPHVSFGIRKEGRSIVLHSLGNFVFFQPQQYWTQRSFGVKLRFVKSAGIAAISIEKVIPLEVGFQTRILTDSTERTKLFRRTQQLSNIDLSSLWENCE